MLSPEDIESIAGRAFEGEVIEVLNYKLRCHSTEKNGFLGDHQNLDISIKRKAGPETHRFFVKSQPHASEEQSRFIVESGLFGQEAAYFNTLLPILKEHCIAEDWCPKCYLANDKLIVLEDVRTRGFAMNDSKVFQGDYLSAALKAQARLHAASLLAEAQLGTPLNEVCPQACTEKIYNDRLLRNKRVELYCDLAQKVARKLGLDSRRINAGLRRGFEQMYKNKSKLRHVVCHGDAWPNNCMFDKSTPLKSVLVDFQLTRYGPRMYDVAQLVYLSTTRETRERLERRVIEDYHDELCEVLRRNNEELERPSLEDVIEEYEGVRLSGLFASVVYYPIIFISKELLAEFNSNEEELYKKIMFRSNNDFVMKVFDNDAKYRGRLAEVVKELIEYCDKLGVPAESQNGTH